MSKDSSNTTISLERIEEDIQWLTQKLGSRPAFSSNARLAALGIRDRLEDAGWTVEFPQLANNIVSCRGKGSVLLLAHSDSVSHSPGTIDNAVAVATLIELARSSKATDLCLGFPAQEEIGLVGSIHMASLIDEWHPKPSELQLVLSLDLVGQGQLSITGLNRDWNHSQLAWLREHSDISSEYGYQIASRLLPKSERSDHRPFAEKGYLSAQLLGRNEDGIFPLYHQETDTEYSTEHIQHLMENLEEIVQNPPPQDSQQWKASILIGQNLLPFWIIWPILIASIIVGLRRFSTIKKIGINLLQILSVFLLWALLSNIGLRLSGFSPGIEEITAQQVLGLPTNGWWGIAPFYSLGLFFVISAAQFSSKCKGSTTFFGGLITAVLTVFDPLLAFPFALGTLLSLFHPLLFLVGGIYWSYFGTLRQLSFWGLLPPELWFLLSLFCLPAILSRESND